MLACLALLAARVGAPSAARAPLPPGLPGGGRQDGENGEGGGEDGGGEDSGGDAAPDIDPDQAFSQIRSAFEAVYGWIAANESQALLAALSAAALWIALLLARGIVKRAIGRFSRNDPYALPSIIARAVGKISAIFLLVVAIAATASFGPAPAILTGPARVVLIVITALQIASLVQEVAVSLLMRRAHRAAGAGSSLATAVTVLKWLISGLVWAIALLVVFDTFGVQVTALIAGLGVGGIAIGLAAQGIFSDLFASLSILFDKPFKKGDFIVVGPIWGSIEEIGLRTTRIRHLHGQRVIMSNTALLSETIHNYQEMSERRHVDNIGVVYQTDAETVAQIPGWLRDCVDAQKGVRFDRAHFVGFGDSALLFELVYFVESPDYYAYMDARQAISLAIMRRFAEAGVDIAYPTRTLFLAAPDGRPIDPRVERSAGGEAGA